MLNYANLVSQGRAKAYGLPWSSEELEFLLLLAKEKGLTRLEAADYIRNGIKSLEDYDKAVEKNFKPLTVDEARDEGAKTVETRGQEAIGQEAVKSGRKTKK